MQFLGGTKVRSAEHTHLPSLPPGSWWGRAWPAQKWHETQQTTKQASWMPWGSAGSAGSRHLSSSLLPHGNLPGSTTKTSPIRRCRLLVLREVLPAPGGAGRAFHLGCCLSLHRCCSDGLRWYLLSRWQGDLVSFILISNVLMLF